MLEAMILVPLQFDFEHREKCKNNSRAQYVIATPLLGDEPSVNVF